MRATKTAAGFASALFLCLLAVDPAGAQQAWTGPMPAPPASAAPADDGQWTMPAKNYASTRYSGLDEINTANVGKLKVAWTFSTGVNRGHEAAPIVVGNTMYVVTPYPEHPLRARPDEAGRAAEVEVRAEARSRRRRASPAATSSTAAPPTPTARSSSTRSTATPSRVDAADRQGGLEDASSATSTRGETITMAPLVVKGKVLVGNSGGEFGVRGWLTALDAETGQDRLARVQHRPRQRRADRPATSSPSTPRTRARTSASRPGRPSSGRSAAARCGAGSPTTPSSNLIYYGTGNPGPVEPRAAPGRQQVDRAASSRATPDTGEARLVLPVQPARPATTTTAINEQHPARPADRRAARARCSSARSATATST